MSSARIEEAPVTHRVGGRPSLHPGKAGKLRPRELAIRFAAGALVSILAGAIGLVFGMRVGGIFLASPAILAAGLTLIEEQEDSAEAREDGHGAIAGGVAMAAFAFLAALTLGHLVWWLALLVASATWLGVALALYVLLWFR